MRLCCIPICRNAKTGADQSVGFHPFPSDPELRSKWIEFVGVDPGKFRWRMKYICSEHFLHSELIEENDLKKLLDGAVPMVFSAEESDDDYDYVEKEDLMVSEAPPESPYAGKVAVQTADLTSEAVMEEVELRTLFCRICLKKRPDLLPFSSKLHNASLTDIIYTVTGLKIYTSGVVPTSICTGCVGKADLAFNVRMEFLHHEKILNNLINAKQLEHHYRSYDLHRFETRSINETYLSNLIDSIKPEMEEPNDKHVEVLSVQNLSPIKLMKNETSVSETPSSTTSSTAAVAVVEENFLEEHLYDEQDLVYNDDKQLEKDSQATVENAPDRREPFVEHENSANLLKHEVFSDSDNDKDAKPKYVFSWKELYKPKPIAKQKRIIEYRPKPKLVPNTCYICNTAHGDADALDSHIEEHVGLLPFTCEECNTPEYPQVFKTLVGLNKHLQTHLYPFQCDYCPHRFVTNHSYSSHMRNLHEELGKDGFTCDYCGQYFAFKRPFSIHIAKHRAMEEAKYKCEHCGKIFGNGALLKRHVRIHTGEKPFECKKCGRRFNHEANFQNHKRLHIGEKAYICTECNKNFVSGTMLRYHMAEHFPDDPQYRAVQTNVQRPRYSEGGKLDSSGLRQYVCEFEGCNFVTTLYRQFFYHRNMHVKKFQCTLCQKRFPFKSTLNKHIMVVHEGKIPEKNLNCPYCPKQFNCKQKLNMHVDIHENNRRHKCQYCEKKFVQKVNCMAHERIHTGVRPYNCRACPASFITSSGRKKHEKTHPGTNSLPEFDGPQDEMPMDENAEDVIMDNDEEDEIDEEIEFAEDDETDVVEGEELVEYAPL